MNIDLFLEKLKGLKNSDDILSRSGNNIYVLQTECKNLFLGKRSNDEYFFIINNVFTPYFDSLKKYENFNFSYISDDVYYAKNSEVKIERFILIHYNSNLLPQETFFGALFAFIDSKKIDLFTLNIMNDFILEIEYLVQKNLISRNEIIGCWGELFVLLAFVELGFNPTQIINSWEFAEGRALHDFKLEFLKLVIEVKTTTSFSREHSFFDVNQLITPDNYIGYVCSLLVEISSDGQTCKELTENIRSLSLEDDDYDNFKIKLRKRGYHLCNENSLKLKIVNKYLFYRFDDIPKPLIDGNIISVNWKVNFDNLESIDSVALINKFI